MEKTTKFNRQTKFKKIRVWQPGEWSGQYEKIVFESCMGASNISLAEKHGFTKEHISNILNTEQARSIKAQYVAAIRQGSLDLMEKQYGEIVSRSVDNIHKVLHRDDLTLNHPFSQFDRSISALKGLGKLQEEAKAGVIINNQTNNNTMIITSDDESKILKGLDKLQQIKLLHSGVTGESIN